MSAKWASNRVQKLFRRRRAGSPARLSLFLHDYVAAPGERSILLADDRGIDHGLAARIFGAVDEAEQIAVVEVTKALNLIDRQDRAAKARHDLRRHLEAKVHPLGTDVKEQVPRRGN